MASQCGFTEQYQSLQRLYDKFLEKFSRAKIVINFSFTGSKNELNQLKGRSFEAALMNCLLMENKSESKL